MRNIFHSYRFYKNLLKQNSNVHTYYVNLFFYLTTLCNKEKTFNICIYFMDQYKLTNLFVYIDDKIIAYYVNLFL